VAASLAGEFNATLPELENDVLGFASELPLERFLL
jgi:hypothetical protein